jgi:hypothetical protein
MKILLPYLKQYLTYVFISACLLCIQACTPSGALAGPDPKATSVSTPATDGLNSGADAIGSMDSIVGTAIVVPEEARMKEASEKTDIDGVIKGYEAIAISEKQEDIPLVTLAEEEYSDSEDEDERTPHFNNIYNLTKSSFREKYGFVFVNNYVTGGEIVTRAQLAQDAASIWKVATGNHKSVTILCVALRQNDGLIKKFVFTNQEPGTDSRHNPNLAIALVAHSLGYHFIQAQQAHAEAQMIEFLHERPGHYTHLVAMGI